MNQHVLIVGGGWAGITCAITLLEQQIPVTLIESAPQLGGRARTVSFTDKAVDNGQHLMMGAYHALGNMLDKLNITGDQNFLRTPLKLNIQSGCKSFLLKLPNLPTPLHILSGLLLAKGISIPEKALALKFCYAMHRQHFEISKDISVAALLYEHNQSSTLIKYFWEPICLAALSTPASYASAHLFLMVLRDAFTGDRLDSDFVFARKDLSAIYPEPAYKHIIKLGGTILTHQRATSLIIEGGVCQGVRAHKRIFRSDYTILATPVSATAALISEVSELEALETQLANIKHESITTIYLQYPAEVTIESEMVGLVGTWSQWVFDRQFAHQPGLMAVVITGIGPHMEVDNKTLIQQVARELHNHFEDIPQYPLEARVIREKRGAFSCRVGVTENRPHNKTALPGLWLAGDYTNTQYPATLEGAVKSGLNAAHQLLKVFEHASSEAALRSA